ncbi:MAG TPA: HEAT repeat domain-containing protein [Microbacteriaceae bacterium]|jgi:HEAT repeat.
MTDHSSNDSVPLDDSPAKRIQEAVQRFGEATVARRAASLLRGRNEGDEFLLWVGGRHAQGILDGAPALYWPEVWGARALMSAWDDTATDAVLAGLGNRAWRVREMCLKVCAERGLNVGTAVQRLTSDTVPRVRSAAARALAATGDASQSEALTAMLRDPDKEVRRTAQQSLAVLSAGTEHPSA